MTTTDTLSQAIDKASAKLSLSALSDARLEAEILLAHTLSRPRTHLFAWPESRLRPDTQADFERLIERRLRGEPSAYLTGRREFWSLELKVTDKTLIPRPESELLVEIALQLLPADAILRIADLGTGSGAIAAAIASERPACKVLATDISEGALAVARENFSSLGLVNVHSAAGPWCTVLPTATQFDLIVSNPPYVAENDPHLSGDGLKWEPAAALISGPDGLKDIREIVATAREHLTPGGWLLLEHGYDQAEQVTRMLSAAGYQHCRTFSDLAGRERATRGRNPTNPPDGATGSG